MTTQPFVTFRVGSQTFALPLAAVQQVIRLPALTLIAGAPPFVVGLLDLYGHVIPVLWGHRLLDQLPTVHLDSMVIVIGLDADHLQLGLLVDEVYKVCHASSDTMTPLRLGSNILSMSLRSDEGVIPVLDPTALHALTVTCAEVGQEAS